jgi:GMP synthase-like glutamine amidotransferase
MSVELNGVPRGTLTATSTADPVRRRWRISHVARQEALLIQHSDDFPGNALLGVLRDHQFKHAVVRADRGAELPDPKSLRLAVILGLDEAGEALGAERLEEELEWIRRADRAGTAILGIGFGAQLLAGAFGGDVVPAAAPLRGWTTVSTEIPHVIAPGPWLSWQENVIEVPPGAQVLAHNRVGVQAFRWQRHLGVQFHPEAAPKVFRDRLATTSEPLDVQGVLDLTPSGARAAAGASERLLSSFVGAF